MFKVIACLSNSMNKSGHGIYKKSVLGILYLNTGFHKDIKD